jgi:hypothetical protein
VIDKFKIKWGPNSFTPFKSARMYDIVPALLQKGVEYLASCLCSIFRACLVLYIKANVLCSDYSEPGEKHRLHKNLTL